MREVGRYPDLGRAIRYNNPRACHFGFRYYR
jgi:hypothetical protein